MRVKISSGFSMLELLVVIGIIGILIAILAPSLEKATERARIAACSSNLHQVAIALNAYANDFNSDVPRGPATASALDPARTWSSIGSHQIWIGTLGQANGLGVLTGSGWLSDAKVLACPSESDSNMKMVLSKPLGGAADVYASYVYRQMDQRGLDRLTVPGNNGMGNAARALVMDWQSDGPAPYQHYSHDSGEYLNVMYCDGHIQFFPNDDRDFGGRASDYSGMPGSYLHRLDQVWVTADWSESNPVDKAPVLP